LFYEFLTVVAIITHGELCQADLLLGLSLGAENMFYEEENFIFLTYPQS
jgi:hypothetical protein